MPPPVKICRIQSRICVGGPAHHTILLSSRLDPNRFETVLIGGTPEPGESDLMDRAAARGIRTERIDEMRRRIDPREDLKAFARLCAILRREKPDIVHTHTAKAGALGRLAARACRVPVVVHTFHGHVLDGYFHPFLSTCFRRTERMLARLTDRIVVISESQKRELSEVHRVARPEKLRTIPLGLELDSFLRWRSRRGLLRHELGLTRGELLVGWVGRFAEVKDPSLFLRACARLVRGGGGAVRFVLVGDGDLRLQAEIEAAGLGIAAQTHFLGYRGDLDRIYADLDLFVLTSRNEGTPVAMIEAMSAGLPVIAPAVGGVEDVARGYPLAEILHDRSEESFATAMGTLLAGRIDRIDGGSIVRRYGVERLIQDIENLYDEILRERGILMPRTRMWPPRAVNSGWRE